ncbi:hypothetical protein VP01_8g5 [Puccinia sorghi]|uniref:Uncharacterized protein n=1 Tax=Puccinia sorghi TaxID=27349 RepID=A0A0L6U9X4_9BASI|nr:hypothetical protein VP01_8g5 [Puccinia sorghi]
MISSFTIHLKDQLFQILNSLERESTSRVFMSRNMKISTHGKKRGSITAKNNFLNCLQLKFRKCQEASAVTPNFLQDDCTKTSTYPNMWSFDVSLAGACCMSTSGSGVKFFLQCSCISSINEVIALMARAEVQGLVVANAMMRVSTMYKEEKTLGLDESQLHWDKLSSNLLGPGKMTSSASAHQDWIPEDYKHTFVLYNKVSRTQMPRIHSFSAELPAQSGYIQIINTVCSIYMGFMQLAVHMLQTKTLRAHILQWHLAVKCQEFSPDIPNNHLDDRNLIYGLGIKGRPWSFVKQENISNPFFDCICKIWFMMRHEWVSLKCLHFFFFELIYQKIEGCSFHQENKWYVLLKVTRIFFLQRNQTVFSIPRLPRGTPIEPSGTGLFCVFRQKIRRK